MNNTILERRTSCHFFWHSLFEHERMVGRHEEIRVRFEKIFFAVDDLSCPQFSSKRIIIKDDLQLWSFCSKMKPIVGDWHGYALLLGNGVIHCNTPLIHNNTNNTFTDVHLPFEMDDTKLQQDDYFTRNIGSRIERTLVVGPLQRDYWSSILLRSEYASLVEWFDRIRGGVPDDRDICETLLNFHFLWDFSVYSSITFTALIVLGFNKPVGRFFNRPSILRIFQKRQDRVFDNGI